MKIRELINELADFDPALEVEIEIRSDDLVAAIGSIDLITDEDRSYVLINDYPDKRG